jgi:hypothetical protein
MQIVEPGTVLLCFSHVTMESLVEVRKGCLSSNSNSNSIVWQDLQASV